jgi:hypothetical protein
MAFGHGQETDDHPIVRRLTHDLAVRPDDLAAPGKLELDRNARSLAQRFENPPQSDALPADVSRLAQEYFVADDAVRDAIEGSAGGFAMLGHNHLRW